jgi:hypothetical protein
MLAYYLAQAIMGVMKREVVIHSKVIADYPNAGRLYYFCRALDSYNQGWVHLPVDLASQFFHVTRTTIQRWLKEMHSAGFTQHIRRVPNTKVCLYDIRLRNFREIEEEVVGWAFAATKLPINDLSDKKLTLQVAYEAAVLSQQERTEQAINLKMPDSRKVFRPTIALTSKDGKRKASNTVKGFPNVGRGLNFFLKSTQQSYGASLVAVCHHLEKARSTVHKHTKHMERCFIWRRTKDPDKAHFTFSQKDPQGNPHKVKEVYYEQRPNYYLAIRDIRNRRCNPEKQQARKAQAAADLKAKTVQEILNTKTQARRSLEDKLVDLDEKQLRKLVWWIMWCLKGVDASEGIAKMSAIELLLQTANLEPELSKVELKFVKKLCSLIKQRKPLRRDLKDIWQTLPDFI